MLTTPQVSQILDALLKCADRAKKGFSHNVTTPAGFIVSMFQGENPWHIEIAHPDHITPLVSVQDPRPYKAAAHAAFDLGEYRKVSRPTPASSDESEAKDWRESPYFRRANQLDDFGQPPTKRSRP